MPCGVPWIFMSIAFGMLHSIKTAHYSWYHGVKTLFIYHVLHGSLLVCCHRVVNKGCRLCRPRPSRGSRCSRFHPLQNRRLISRTTTSSYAAMGASITQFRTPLNPWSQCLLRWNLSPNVHPVAPRRRAMLPVGWTFILGPCPPYVKAATPTTPD